MLWPMAPMSLQEIPQIRLHAEGEHILDGAIGQMGVEYGGEVARCLAGVAF